MDTECRDFADYAACLRDLARVNTVTRTHAPTLAWIARAVGAAERFSLLDVACGHGDLLRKVRDWAARHGKQASLTGIDLNPWAVRAAKDAGAEGIEFRQGDVFAFAEAIGKDVSQPDLIVTSQFTHHLDPPALVRFLRWIDRAAGRGWYVADLRRHWFAYYGFPLLARLMLWHRFVRHDGQVSIARAFTRADWRGALAEAGVAARIDAHWPFRLNVSRLR